MTKITNAISLSIQRQVSESDSSLIFTTHLSIFYNFVGI